MEIITKEQAIKLYIKMAESDDSEISHGRVLLYHRRRIVASAVIHHNLSSAVLSIYPLGLDFPLTDEEYNDLYRKPEYIASQRGIEILTEMLK